jgi:hypothetical protein
MFKGIVTKLAKEAWDNAARPAPEPRPQPAAQPGHVEHLAEAVAEPEVETDIEFPYYPGDGTACDAECRCRWQVEVRWSDEFQSRATFATWRTAGDGDVCPDCQRRAEEWQDVMVRLEPS